MSLLPGAIALVSLVLASSSEAITFGQQDTFQNETTMGWQEGGSPNPPTNVPTGGPAGLGDAYLENVSAGGTGAGSKMIMFNLEQWTGNYVIAGVDRISVQMANLGANTLFMRVGIRGGDGSTIFASSSATVLPADGVWRAVDFDLTASGLTNVSGANTLQQVLGNVIEFRLLSAIGGPAFTGDPIAAKLGTDNIVARETAPRIFRITDVRFVGNAPRVPHLRFATVAGRSHRVEHKNGLGDATWTPLSNATNIVGDGSGFAEVDDLEPGAANQAKRFYRVVLLPPS